MPSLDPPDRPNGSSRFGKESPSMSSGAQLIVIWSPSGQGLDMVIGEPDRGSFEGDVRLCGQVHGQDCHEAVTISNCGFGTLSKLRP